MPPTPWVPLEEITAAKLNAMVPVGPFEYFIPAAAWWPSRAYQWCGPHERVSNPTSYGEVIGLPFDPTTVEVARTAWKLPGGIDEASALGIRIYWLNKVGGAGVVRWETWWGGFSGALMPTAGMGAMTPIHSSALGAHLLTDSGHVSAHAPSPTLSANQVLWVQLARRPEDAADTYPSDAYFLGAKFILYFNDTVDA